MDVQKGDWFGFYWSNYGVAAFDFLERDVNDPEKNRNYCGANVNPNNSPTLVLLL